MKTTDPIFASYETATAVRNVLQARCDAASEVYHTIPGIGSGPMGLTPDHVKALPQWRPAYDALENASEHLRQFNRVYVRLYAKQIRADIMAQRMAKLQHSNP